MNTIPHPRPMRYFFYEDVTRAVMQALDDGILRMSVRCTVPELNTDFDVYRVGTLLEMVREMATALAQDGKRVKVCVQQSLGEGIFAGMPMMLSGVARILKAMDWGEAGEWMEFGAVGAGEVESADAFVIVAPQNMVGNSILPFLDAMVSAAGAAGKPVVLLNANLGDIQSSSGVMGVRNRQGHGASRLDFAATFQVVYHFRLLYSGPFMYPIVGALRYSHGGRWEVYKRVPILAEKTEVYTHLASFDTQPGSTAITAAFHAFQRSQW
ncbi:hypothetical protein F751_1781 [Auxenochlorella protothecoides]|uniref:DUF1995 domain-containing protein n=1 Tax=Auxenochlorella protothecoides TaxID=3075 RepID=A0A087SGP8_AUXPR|nr:hypothetical protein F751_1781 [Auxenochlorella protothecoides]KFM24902.1 hypothetical protein F751_1781 [Auxenochlorella protothecoides]RMZ52748.1 hypothetical protein APUTEX25_000867 [Auxenochlorella protothecoides]|eukprot:RMZ52748.1 hypothetical protein APUTEX25_000867 [Auxenochlorella protothecoides]